MVGDSNLCEKHSGTLLFITTTTLLKHLSFLKETATCPLLVESQLTVQFHLVMVTNMAVNTHRTLPCPLFSRSDSVDLASVTPLLLHHMEMHFASPRKEFTIALLSSELPLFN